MINLFSTCKRCIMDKTDPKIKFNSEGLCEYCINFDENVLPDWHKGLENKNKLDELSYKIQLQGKNKDFDCIIGLSGGLDSSYAAYVAKEKMNLNPLFFHVDAGWNTDQAVGNIEKLVDGLNANLYTEVINWDAIKRMQVAFLKSGIPDQDLVQDAVFFSELYKFARKNKIKYIITGSNYSTECCREPEEWGGYLGIDTRLFKDIWNKFGDGKPNSIELIDVLISKILYQKIYGMKVVYPLNMISYIKKDAENELKNRFGWQPFLKQIDEWIIPHYSTYKKIRENSEISSFFKYEDLKEHPKKTFLELTKNMKISIQENLVDELISKLEKPFKKKISKNQDINYSHTRSGKSRQFEYEIEKKTLKLGNDKLKDLLNYWNFKA